MSEGAILTKAATWEWIKQNQSISKYPEYETREIGGFVSFRLRPSGLAGEDQIVRERFLALIEKYQQACQSNTHSQVLEKKKPSKNIITNEKIWKQHSKELNKIADKHKGRLKDKKTKEMVLLEIMGSSEALVRVIRENVLSYLDKFERVTPTVHLDSSGRSTAGSLTSPQTFSDSNYMYKTALQSMPSGTSYGSNANSKETQRHLSLDASIYHTAKFHPEKDSLQSDRLSHTRGHSINDPTQTGSCSYNVQYEPQMRSNPSVQSSGTHSVVSNQSRGSRSDVNIARSKVPHTTESVEALKLYNMTVDPQKIQCISGIKDLEKKYGLKVDLQQTVYGTQLKLLDNKTGKDKHVIPAWQELDKLYQDELKKKVSKSMPDSRRTKRF